MQLTSSGIREAIAKIVKEVFETTETTRPILVVVKNTTLDGDGDNCYFASFYVDLVRALPRGRYFAVVINHISGIERMKISCGQHGTSVFVNEEYAKQNYHLWKTAGM